MPNKVLEAKVVYEGCKITSTLQLHVINCGMCGGSYALSARYVAKKKECGGFWTCPYCESSWGYPVEGSDVQRLQKQLTQQKEATAYQRLQKEDALTNCERLNRSRNGLKGALTKEKKRLTRVKHGVCPCCKRNFQNLRRHMKGQHPDFQEGST